MASDIVIIGAGPGGLAAAMLLGHAGHRVTVLERADRVGGRTSTIEEQGYRFDLGPTFFLYPEILREIYETCGMSLDDRVELRRLDPHYKLHFEGDTVLTAYPDTGTMDREVTGLSPEDAGGFARFMEDNRKKFESFAPVLQKPFSSALDLIDPRFVKLLPHFRPKRSVEKDLRRFFKDERLRLACAFQSKYLGMSPFVCPSIFTILSFLEYAYGIFHPVGGCAAVSHDMAKAAEEMGVDIRLSEPAVKIDFEGKRAKRVITERGTYECDALVVNADFSHAMKELVPNRLRRKWSDEAIARKKYSCSTFMMYLGVNKTFPELTHHTIFLGEDYRDTLHDIEHGHRLSDNPAIYLCNPVLTDPSMAPEGKSALYVLVPVTHQHENVDWSEQQAAFRDLTLRQLDKLGVSLTDSDIEYERVLPPSTWEHDYAVHKGAVFNLAHSLDQMLHKRPQNRFKELDGVYLVGGGTHPGSGLPVIYESARITTRLVQKDLGR
ncbi:MAG: phytoene desaturase family protein [Planctomycetota bacterium]